jgi:cobalt-zinc-cadmium efflux system protein
MTQHDSEHAHDHCSHEAAQADHDHNHSGGHSHAHHAPQSFNLAFALAISFNFSFIILEIFYALYANSMGLMADAAHNFGDVLGLSLAWGANWLLTKPARKRYSYGYKRTTILAAVTNALVLVASSAIIAYESIHKLMHLSQVNEHVVIGVALLGILVNGGTALLFMKGSHDDLNIKGAFLHLLYDALIAFGVVVAGVAILVTGQEWLDPLVGLVIVITILWGTWGLLRNSIRLILDAVPHHIDHRGVDKFLRHLPGVTALHDLHIWGLSTKEVALTAHIVMQDNQFEVDYKKINTVLREQFRINHVTIQVEMENSDFLCLRTETC